MLRKSQSRENTFTVLYCIYHKFTSSVLGYTVCMQVFSNYQLKENKPCIIGPSQFKPMVFKHQLYIISPKKWLSTLLCYNTQPNACSPTS